MEITIGYNCSGETGLIERNPIPGNQPRVFRIVSGSDGDCLEWKPRDEWHADGWQRGRTYGSALAISDLIYC